MRWTQLFAFAVLLGMKYLQVVVIVDEDMGSANLALQIIVNDQVQPPTVFVWVVGSQPNPLR